MIGSLCLYAHPYRESNHLGQTPGLSVRPNPHLGQTRPCGTNQESASGAPQGRTGGAASCPRHARAHRNNVASTASPQRLLGPARSPNHTYIRTNAHHSSRMLSLFLVPPCAQTVKKITDTDRQHTSVYIACCVVQCSAVRSHLPASCFSGVVNGIYLTPSSGSVCTPPPSSSLLTAKICCFPPSVQPGSADGHADDYIARIVYVRWTCMCMPCACACACASTSAGAAHRGQRG